jgi:hypothetical protein
MIYWFYGQFSGFSSSVRLMTLAILSMPSGHAIAQDDQIVAQSVFKGFSGDGKYAAFEMTENVPWPGRDVTRTSIFILDVDKNAYAIKHFEMDTDSADQPGFREAYEKYNKTVKNYGISGDRLGNRIVFNERNGNPTFFVGIEKYELKVSLIPVPDRDNESEVMVKVLVIHNEVPNVLQQPEKAPASWGITVDYKLGSAYVYKNKIAIFLQYRSSMIEERDKLRDMLVTGVLK